MYLQQSEAISGRTWAGAEAFWHEDEVLLVVRVVVRVADVEDSFADVVCDITRDDVELRDVELWGSDAVTRVDEAIIWELKLLLELERAGPVRRLLEDLVVVWDRDDVRCVLLMVDVEDFRLLLVDEDRLAMLLEETGSLEVFVNLVVEVGWLELFREELEMLLVLSVSEERIDGFGILDCNEGDELELLLVVGG
jgi:hypothetical protein